MNEMLKVGGRPMGVTEEERDLNVWEVMDVIFIVSLIIETLVFFVAILELILDKVGAVNIVSYSGFYEVLGIIGAIDLPIVFISFRWMRHIERRWK